MVLYFHILLTLQPRRINAIIKEESTLKQHNGLKELKDLNLLDRFLFAETVEDPETLADILEIILGKDVVLRQLPQTEKEERVRLWSKQVRLDVWALDEDHSVYETEVQNRNTGNLPRRMRLYHGIIDSRLLPPGEIDYNKLPDVFLILIAPFDLFGEGRFRYTFQNMCKEVPGLALDDGAIRIFLNTRGQVQEGVSQELIDLLRYFEHSTEETAAASESEKIHRLQKRVETIRSSEEMGVKFMNEWEERILDREEAFAEGLEEGLERLEKGRKEIALKLKIKGMKAHEIAEITGISPEEAEKL